MVQNPDKLTSVVDRLLAPTPSFWIKVRNIAITIGSIGVAIVAIPASVVVFPAAVLTVAGYMIATGLVAAATAQTTVK